MDEPHLPIFIRNVHTYINIKNYLNFRNRSLAPHTTSWIVDVDCMQVGFSKWKPEGQMYAGRN